MEEYHCMDLIINGTCDLEVRMHTDGKNILLFDGEQVDLRKEDMKNMINWCNKVSEKFSNYLQANK